MFAVVKLAPSFYFAQKLFQILSDQSYFTFGTNVTFITDGHLPKVLAKAAVSVRYILIHNHITPMQP